LKLGFALDAVECLKGWKAVKSWRFLRSWLVEILLDFRRLRQGIDKSEKLSFIGSCLKSASPWSSAICLKSVLIGFLYMN
jgi:hypothetical protein